MNGEVRILLLVLLANALAVLLYWLWNRFLRRSSRRSSYCLRCVVMLLCPVAGIIFFLLGQGLYRLFFRKPVDLEDVIFSKDRVKTFLKADEEKERDFVPLEEAIAVTDTGSTRTLMMEVVRRDISHSLSTISLALNSDDSEVSHYAASVLQETLGKLRMDIQRMHRQVLELEEEMAEYDGEDGPLVTEAGLQARQRLETGAEPEEHGPGGVDTALENASDSVQQDTRHKGAQAVPYREEDIRARTREQAHAQALIARDGLPDEANKDIAQKLTDEVEQARELMDDLYQVLCQHVFSPLEQESCTEMMEEMAVLLDRRDVLSPEELRRISMQQLEMGKPELCRRWCDRAAQLWPMELTTYTCRLKLCYTTGEREAFFAAMDELKRSGVSLDHDTLELIRLFM
jgi:hypothetical protein